MCHRYSGADGADALDTEPLQQQLPLRAPSGGAADPLRAERQRQRYERLSRTLDEVKGAVQQLADKLQHVPIHDGSAPIELSDETVPEVLAQAEARLALLLPALQAEEQALEAAGVPLAAELSRAALLQPPVENNLRIRVSTRRGRRERGRDGGAAHPAPPRHRRPQPPCPRAPVRAARRSGRPAARSALRSALPRR